MVPLRANMSKLAEKWPSKIILHHTACQISTGGVVYDKNVFQFDEYNSLNYKLRGQVETGFNFVMEKTGLDYNIVVSQPLLTYCVHDDIDEKYQRDIHIALLGDYNSDIPPMRIYSVLAYRLLIPLMRMFSLQERDIILHSVISNDEDQDCPGGFFDMNMLVSQIRKYIKIRTLARRG